MNNLKFNVLTAQELKDCTDVILEARPVILKWSDKIYGEFCPRKFRREYYTGVLEKYNISKQEKAKLEKIQSIELPILEHNHRICYSLASKYYTNNRYKGVSKDDFLQEAYMGVIYGIYSWSGETKFITCIYRLISNNLNNYVRIEHPLSPPSPFIQKYGIQVQELMSKEGVSFDQALVNLNIPKKQNLNVLRVITNAYSENEDISISNLAIDEDSEIEDYTLMKEALETCSLTRVEKAAFIKYMNGSKVDLTKNFKITRQAVHAALKRAKNKIQKRYFELAPSELIQTKQG